MLTPEYLDSVSDNVINLYCNAQLKIIEDMARRISKTDMLTESADWQYQKALELSSTHEYISQELSRLTGKTQGELRKLFADAGTETLLYDDKIYRSAGLSPKSLSESKALMQIIETGLKKTNQLFKNLTRTTAKTATKQFEDTLDTAYMQIVSGAFDYQTAVKHAIQGLSNKGIASIVYPSGHTDYLDVAVRRATLTGVSQTALQLQGARADEMECDLVETTAHAGARPEHQEWQGKVFSLSGKNKRYPPFSQTGYGTGAGLGGWNCRHGYYPYFEGISTRANTLQELEFMNNQTVTYNGKELTAYEVTQLQRELERNIRKYKREAVAMEVAGFDNRFSQSKVKEWQAKQRDFISEAGLKRDYFRERAGKQNLEKPLNSDIIKLKAKGLGIKGDINYTPAPIDISSLSFDDKHINKERSHNVTKEQAKDFINNAIISNTRWNGRFTNYYSADGIVYVDNVRNEIRTAFSKDEFDDKITEFMEVIIKYGKSSE